MKRESLRPEGSGSDPFDEFVAARYQPLLRGAYLITGNVHDARDLLHDALAQVYPRRSTIRDAGATEGYVRRTMVRTHISRWRRTRREVLTSAPPDGPAVQDAERDDELATALAGLPPRQRAAVVLRYYLDLPVAQVAEELGCTVPTAKTHLARGIKALRQELEPVRELVGRGR
ncbi:SigE family RNA polymerase sigma factor [Kitasatospora sp. NPDC056651]|uniref:SigE family RNA polymerase sigma factor n=1 Tax=Kitasatospora sp. NPDC056651 TaxID=3345892 RepID=UPI00368C203B